MAALSSQSRPIPTVGYCPGALPFSTIGSKKKWCLLLPRLVDLTGSIAPPPRSSRMGAAIVVAAIVALSLVMILPHPLRVGGIAALVLLFPTAIAYRAIYAVHIIVLSLLWIALVAAVPLFRLWPLVLLVPLLAYAAVVIAVAPLRRSVGWLRAGRLDRATQLLILVTVIVSAVALVAWVAWTEPDLGRHLALVPDVPIWMLPLAAVAFAALNAAMEEIIFRGVLMEALDSALGADQRAIAAQAVAFAAGHYLSGFPNGALGFVMVLTYGVLLGLIRRRAGGLMAPWLAHVAADLVIFSILVVMVSGSGNPPLTS